jgi:hypothetical protein
MDGAHRRRERRKSDRPTEPTERNLNLQLTLQAPTDRAPGLETDLGGRLIEASDRQELRDRRKGRPEACRNRGTGPERLLLVADAQELNPQTVNRSRRKK